jgi:phage tail-like protein
VAELQDPFTVFNFEVDLTIPDATSLGMATTLCNMEFAECDGLEMTMEPKTVREGGNNTRQFHLPGPVSFGTLTLKRGMTQNQDIWNWFSAVADGRRRNARASGVIRLNGRDASVTNVSYELQDCLPIKVKAPGMNAKDGVIAIEELQIAYTTMSIKLGA